MNVGVGVRLHAMALHVDDDLGELIELVSEQLSLTPVERLEFLLGEHWPACRDALQAAAAVNGLAALVGPVAVALHGGPQQPGRGRVDLLCAPEAQDDVAYGLIDVGAAVGSLWRASQQPGTETQLEFTADAGVLTLRTRAAAIVDPVDVVAAGRLVDVAGAVVRVASLEDLIAITFASPWGQDGPYRSGLRALRAHRAVHGAAAA